MYNADDHPLGVSEVAIVLSVKPDTVSSWQIRKIMPIPDALINDGRTRLWRVKTVLDWASATGRNEKGIDTREAVSLLAAHDNKGTNIDDFTSRAAGFDDQWGDLGDFKE